MEAAGDVATDAFPRPSCHGEVSARVGHVCPARTVCVCSSTPHPRPLPATRCARGGRGAVRCSLKSSIQNRLLIAQTAARVLCEPSQSGAPAVRLQVQKNTLLVSSAVNCRGENSEP